MLEALSGLALGVIGVDGPQCIDVGDGAEDRLAALAFIRHGFPLVVEARVAESDCALGIEVGMAVANGMEAENRVGDVGWIFIVLEHVRFNPYVPVGVGDLPSN